MVIKIPKFWKKHNYDEYNEYDEEYSEYEESDKYDDRYEDAPDVNEKMTIGEFGVAVIKFLCSVVLGFILACLTFVKVVPNLPFVECVADVNDPDWGADFPEHTLAYATYEIPVISDSVEFGQYITWKDGAKTTVSVVTAVSDDGTFTVADARGEETVIRKSQCTGVVTFTIPFLGRFVQ